MSVDINTVYTVRCSSCDPKAENHLEEQDYTELGGAIQYAEEHIEWYDPATEEMPFTSHSVLITSCMKVERNSRW